MSTRKDTNATTKRRIVATLLERHGNRCMVAGCGRVDLIIGGPTTDGMTFNLGHVVSEANGGHFTISNLLGVCRRCNVEMSDDDWPTDLMLATPTGGTLAADPGSRLVNMEPGPLARRRGDWTETL